jgi:hypothetical protein
VGHWAVGDKKVNKKQPSLKKMQLPLKIEWSACHGRDTDTPLRKTEEGVFSSDEGHWRFCGEEEPGKLGSQRQIASERKVLVHQNRTRYALLDVSPLFVQTSFDYLFPFIHTSPNHTLFNPTCSRMSVSSTSSTFSKLNKSYCLSHILDYISNCSLDATRK